MSLIMQADFISEFLNHGKRKSKHSEAWKFPTRRFALVCTKHESLLKSYRPRQQKCVVLVPCPTDHDQVRNLLNDDKYSTSSCRFRWALPVDVLNLYHVPPKECPLSRFITGPFIKILRTGLPCKWWALQQSHGETVPAAEQQSKAYYEMMKNQCSKNLSWGCSNEFGLVGWWLVYGHFEQCGMIHFTDVWQRLQWCLPPIILVTHLLPVDSTIYCVSWQTCTDSGP